MTLLFKRLIIGILTFCFSKAFAQSDFDKGLIAFDKKEYKVSFTILKPYAEQGNCTAQYVLGFSYSYGLHVIKNDSLAIQWLTLAAEQKQTNAMGPLAVLLMSSNHEENMPKAYMWAMLAAEYLPSQRLTSARYVIKSYLNSQQLDEGNKLIEEYKQKWKDKEDCH